MILEQLTVGMLQCNCAILGDEKTGEAIVIDPGDEVERIVALLEKHNLKLRHIINTHTHIDHVGGCSQLKDLTGAEMAIHKSDLFLYENLKMQASWMGILPPPTTHVDVFLEAGDEIKLEAIKLGVLHTPGHTPGSLSFHLDGATIAASKSPEQILFTGDTLFLSSIGRTDLWGGSFEEIMKSIHQQLMRFDDETRVIPGHGPATTIGRERRANPFLQRG